MEEVIVRNKKFISSKRAAKESGYTPDYIGQMCRAGKIDGTLVGRSWYVDLQSVLRHKQTHHTQNEGEGISHEQLIEPLTYIKEAKKEQGVNIINTQTARHAAPVRYTPDQRQANPLPVKKSSDVTSKKMVQTTNKKVSNTPIPTQKITKKTVTKRTRLLISVPETIFLIFLLLFLGTFFVEQTIEYSAF